MKEKGRSKEMGGKGVGGSYEDTKTESEADAKVI